MKNDIIRIMGIDPGLTNTGINISQYDISTSMLTVTNFILLQANNLAKKEFKSDSKMYGNIVSLDVYERELDAIINKYNPDYVCCEDSFYNPHCPNAYLSLSLCITSIRRMLYHNHQKILYTIPPKSAKKWVCTGDANKLAIQEAIFKLPDLTIHETKKTDLSNISEHEMDSAAITYAFTKEYLLDLIIQRQK